MIQWGSSYRGNYRALRSNGVRRTVDTTGQDSAAGYEVRRTVAWGSSHRGYYRARFCCRTCVEKRQDSAAGPVSKNGHLG
ncbi:unnamed protein product [Echinostoma caproni]|uniref:GCM domain-containing protein n=1 Tax=Echinostoma caproni TaxID=27848 RepID=A0A183A4T6_9TREM|nr:unnamed protein product [Echinostoma caproni]